MRFVTALTLDEALTALAEGARPIAGGSDLVVAHRHGKALLPDSVVAIDRIEALRRIEGGTDELSIGALTTHHDIETHPHIAERYSALADASALVGSPSTRNVGTLGGNVMNASPAMDTGAPLLVFGADIELTSAADGTRRVPVGELWTGPGRTVARPDELCTAIHLPRPVSFSGSAYVRLEYRRAMEIAVVGAAANLAIAQNGTLAGLAVALTAVAPTIVAVTGLEALLGNVVDEAMFAAIAELAAEQASPISDLRASDRYRRHCVGIMARRAAEAAARRAHGDIIAVPVNRSLGIGAAS
jgi:CO/xanthine dehydrogenase FAD-binding subunit